MSGGRRARLVLAAMVMCTLATAGIGGGSARALTPSSVRQASGYRLQYHLIHAVVSQTAIFGRSIVWTETVPPRHGNLVPERLFTAPVSHVVKHLLFSFPSGTTVVRLAVSADWVVASLSGTAGSSLWAFNRISKMAHTVASWPVTGGVTLVGFTLLDDQVVFTTDRLGANPRNGQFSVVSKTLPNGAESTVLTRFVRCGQIQVAGQDGTSWLATISHGCSESDAVLIDPTTDSVTPLVGTDHRELSAFANGIDGGWLKVRPAAGTLAPTGVVILRRIRGRSDVPVSHAPPLETKTCVRGTLDVCAASPGMTSKLAYWIDGSGQPTAYDLLSGREVHIKSIQPPSISGMGQGDGRYLTWSSAVSQPEPGRPESWIVVARVPATQ